MAPQDLRLQPGDVLKVNFNPENPILKEDWNLTVCESFDWSYQGESVGILKRPLVPLDDDAIKEEKRAYRHLVGTIIPAVDGNMDSEPFLRVLYGENVKDQLDLIEHLGNTPVNEQRKAVGIVEGFPGVGKTAFLAYVVVCMLAQRPQAPIGCICAANQPTDILAKAIEHAIELLLPESQAETAPKAAYSNYIEKDNNALPVTEEGYEGDFSQLILKNALLSDGSFNLADPHTKALFTNDTVLDMAASINRQLAPGVHGVKDTRFRVPEMSSAYKVLEAFLPHDGSFQAAALRKQYSEEGKAMAHEDVRESLKDLLPKAIKSARGNVKVVLTTPSQTVTTKQFTPQAPLLQGSQGWSRQRFHGVVANALKIVSPEN
ncbi:hypothetical protein BcDW1_7814 [Botrytis cinerea BcDW1]|uniref:Uncharacterized protein n=1 Tax=Botryotinia fuckeliana (strain BcDW1) TaxID=1290391 RepID=M7UA68_BOTF1|nr:hypothetical protein BcDW1_7814 [Botrytis cinerea BcDW1]